MNVNSISNNILMNGIQSANRTQQSLSSNSLKDAINAPQQFLALLEQSINVKSSVDLANGLGINVDTSV